MSSAKASQYEVNCFDPVAAGASSQGVTTRLHSSNDHTELSEIIAFQPEVQKAVQVKMMDQNAAVREATIELVGKYVIAKPDVLPQYYEILIERVKVSLVSS